MANKNSHSIALQSISCNRIKSSALSLYVNNATHDPVQPVGRVARNRQVVDTGTREKERERESEGVRERRDATDVNR